MLAEFTRTIIPEIKRLWRKVSFQAVLSVVTDVSAYRYAFKGRHRQLTAFIVKECKPRRIRMAAVVGNCYKNNEGF
jgi:hypothetical protein